MKFLRNEGMKLHAMIVGALLLASTTFGQTVEEIATAKSQVEFQADKDNLTFEFKLPAQISEQQVNEAKADYTQFFSVDFNADSDVLKIQLNSGTNEEKFFVQRLLASMHVMYVEQDGQVTHIHDFSTAHIQN